jgi:hypothetical protein
VPTPKANINVSKLLLAVFICAGGPITNNLHRETRWNRCFTKFYAENASLALGLAEEYVSRDVRTRKARKDWGGKAPRLCGNLLSSADGLVERALIFPSTLILL